MNLLPHTILLVALLAAQPASAQGLALVSSEKDHAIAVVDLATRAVTGTIATCKRPRHMQLLSEGRQLLVATHSHGCTILAGESESKGAGA